MFSSSKRPSEPQFCERCSLAKKMARSGLKTQILGNTVLQNFGVLFCENKWGGVGRSTFPAKAFKYLGAFQCKFDEQFELFERHDAYAETSESISASFQGSWHSP